MTKRTLVIVIIVNGLILLGGIAATYYLSSELTEKEKDLEEITKKVDEARQKIQKIPALEVQKQELLKTVQKMEMVIPTLDEREYDKFLETLEKVRKEVGVVIPEIKFSPLNRAPGTDKTVLPPNIQKVEFELKVYGSFYQLLKFMNLLEMEAYQRHFMISKFTITPGKNDTVHELKIPLSVFTYKAAEAAVSPKAQEVPKTTVIPH